jgi:hypothetical protein
LLAARAPLLDHPSLLIASWNSAETQARCGLARQALDSVSMPAIGSDGSRPDLDAIARLA